MSRIARVFGELRRGGGKALIPYLTVGYPKLDWLADAVEALAEAGADCLELGIPFSDPLADGPTIQAASQQALLGGVTMKKALREVERIRRRNGRLPLIAMTYFNPVLAYGPRAFCRDAAAAGLDGVIVPDLPPEEGWELIPPARAAGLDTIFLAAPTSGPARLTQAARVSRGFVYYVSLTGVTGERRGLPAGWRDGVRLLKRRTRLPVCVGFGVSTPEQVRQIAGEADGVIVGSALIRKLTGSKREGIRRGAAFLKRLKGACR